MKHNVSGHLQKATRCFNLCFCLSKNPAHLVILDIIYNSVSRVESFIKPQKQQFMFQFLSCSQYFRTSCFIRNFMDFSVFFLTYYAPVSGVLWWDSKMPAAFSKFTDTALMKNHSLENKYMCFLCQNVKHNVIAKEVVRWCYASF